MQYDTAGNPIIFYDQCAYCRMNTAGNHESTCPLAPRKDDFNKRDPTLPRIFKYDDAGNFLQEIV